MKRKQWIGAVLLGMAVSLVLAATVNAQTRATSPVTRYTPTVQAGASKAAAQNDNEGQRVFGQNCSRCHMAPEAFSQHIAGTVVRHMRVRASLSEHDEQVLLRFFNGN